MRWEPTCGRGDPGLQCRWQARHRSGEYRRWHGFGAVRQGRWDVPGAADADGGKCAGGHCGGRYRWRWEPGFGGRQLGRWDDFDFARQWRRDVPGADDDCGWVRAAECGAGRPERRWLASSGEQANTVTVYPGLKDSEGDYVLGRWRLRRVDVCIAGRGCREGGGTGGCADEQRGERCGRLDSPWQKWLTSSWADAVV